MSYESSVSYSGKSILSTLNGKIRFDEGRGRISIDNDDSIEVTRLDQLGLTTIQASTGDYKNRVGVASSDGRDGIWTAKPGQDLQDLGI